MVSERAPQHRSEGRAWITQQACATAERPSACSLTTVGVQRPLTADQLREVIASGESVAVEFMGEESAPLGDRELVEAVACLANRSDNGPGWLLVGVEDDGRVSGARARPGDGQTENQRVQALIATRTRPFLATRVEAIEVDGREVVVIEVLPARRPVGTSDGLYLRRAVSGEGMPLCLPFHFLQMQSRQADLGLVDFTAFPLQGLSFAALDPLEFERYRRSIRENRRRGDETLLALGNLELAKALGAVEVSNGEVAVRVLGLLLFGREDVLASAIPTHEVAFQLVSDGNVEVNDFLRWPLLRAMEELEARFRAHNRERETLVGMTRIGVPNVPGRAFREGIANALTHRDYTQSGAVHVAWHNDRLEISNPGGFPEGVRVDNILITQPRPRNPLLADAFRRAGIVERTGRGVDTIFAEQVRTGHSPPSYRGSSAAGVLLELPCGEPNLEFVQFVAEQGLKDHPFRQEELLLLHALSRKFELTAAEAASAIQREAQNATDVLEALRERGVAESRRTADGLTYRLSASASLRLDSRLAGERSIGQQGREEALVLGFLDGHASISRREAAELCGIASPRSYRLLRKMEDKGVLRRTAQRGRGVRYERCKQKHAYNTHGMEP